MRGRFLGVTVFNCSNRIEVRKNPRRGKNHGGVTGIQTLDLCLAKAAL